MSGGLPRFYAAAALQSFAMAMGGFVVTMRATLLGASEAELGLGVGAGPALAYTLACWGAGRLVPVLGPKRMAAAGCALLAGLFAALSQARSVGTLVLLANLLYASLSLYWPALMAWLSHGRAPEELGRVFPAYNLCWSGAAVLAPAVGGALLERVGPDAFLVSAAFAAAPLLALLPHPDARVPSAAAREEAGDAARLRDRGLWRAALGANFALNAVHGLVFTFLPKIGDAAGLAPSRIGALFLLCNAAQTAMFGLLRASPFWRGRLAPALAAQILGAATGAAVACGGGAPAYAAACAALGLGAGLSYNLSIFYSLQAGQGGRGSALHEANLAAAHVLGPALGAALAGAAPGGSGLRFPFAAAAAILLFATALQAALAAARRPAPEAEA